MQVQFDWPQHNSQFRFILRREIFSILHCRHFPISQSHPSLFAFATLAGSFCLGGLISSETLKRLFQATRMAAIPVLKHLLRGAVTMKTSVGPDSYQSYRGLPTLAGLATIAQATKPGLSVAACVARLKRYHYAFLRLHEILTARITAEPIYELKTGFSHHAYLCSEHVLALRTRIGEMREPPLGLEETPHAALAIFFDEILAAPTTAELLLGVYEKALPALDAALARHFADTNPLADAPSVRVCRFARLELADMIAFGTKSIACLVDASTREAMPSWLELLDACLAAAGGLDGTSPPSGTTVTRKHSAKPY